ncbi:hypothetical protein M501DRAFT_995778 [Patellaria atrata CBS 101060]|uniref:Uncharacterized protein n=1 Tax=Patellaria atrata CBS 101060 TaxID=1346257 RepID=A0A9P4S8X4_9PEZI|nr:hypothetical protein M501DRAFT_995778 [Patellaria atrata CBS 101060]
MSGLSINKFTIVKIRLLRVLYACATGTKVLYLALLLYREHNNRLLHTTGKVDTAGSHSYS